MEESKAEKTPKDTSEPIEVTDPKQLTAIYKRNGSFDRRRKLLLEDFKSSETHYNLMLKLRLMVENKVKNDPTILIKNRGKMGALIQGSIINDHMQQKDLNDKNDNSLLSIVDKDIQEKIIDSPEFSNVLKTELKDIRRRLMNLSDEEYAKQQEDEREQERREEEEKKENAEKEFTYKNNFKVKNIDNTSRVSKPPRISFAFNRTADLTKNGNSSEDFSNTNTNSGSTPNREESNGNDYQKSTRPFMMY